MVVIEGVVDVPPFFAETHQIQLTQMAELM
jgi:hypothetical protein